jgi:hypothetical protein
MIAVIALGLASVGVAEAGSKDLEYEFHLGSASFPGNQCVGVLPTDPPIPVNPGGPANCRPVAVAEDFAGTGTGSIAIQGEGTLKVSDKGKPKKVKGGGEFAIYSSSDSSGMPTSWGTWKAKKLLLFDAYGEDDVTPLPDGFESGRVLMLIRLDPEDGKKIDAVLEIGCRLPGNKGIVGTIEGTRVMVDGGLNYNLPVDPKATLFVNLQNFVP